MKLRAKAAKTFAFFFLSVAGTTKPAAGRSHGTTTAVDATILYGHPKKRDLGDVRHWRRPQPLMLERQFEITRGT